MEVTNFYNYGTMNQVEPGATQINHYYGSEKPEEEAVEPVEDEELTRRLVPLFNSEEEAGKFPARIKGMKNMEITKLVNVLWDKGVFSNDTKPTDLWRVLHDMGYYTAGDRNWNDQVFFTKKR